MENYCPYMMALDNWNGLCQVARVGRLDCARWLELKTRPGCARWLGLKTRPGCTRWLELSPDLHTPQRRVIQVSVANCEAAILVLGIYCQQQRIVCSVLCIENTSSPPTFHWGDASRAVLNLWNLWVLVNFLSGGHRHLWAPLSSGQCALKRNRWAFDQFWACWVLGNTSETEKCVIYYYVSDRF